MPGKDFEKMFPSEQVLCNELDWGEFLECIEDVSQLHSQCESRGKCHEHIKRISCD